MSKDELSDNQLNNEIKSVSEFKSFLLENDSQFVEYLNEDLIF
jgi:hypothetical protein